ncbi:MAG: hypothetical protein RDV48_21660 [Candidatus Eremiobacteraeota bacterium]|nr:hypothetical protein [Candidatus Eremiobacteraeota bacterium]
MSAVAVSFDMKASVPANGREQAGVRPGLIISVDQFNHGPAESVVLVPEGTLNAVEDRLRILLSL